MSLSKIFVNKQDAGFEKIEISKNSLKIGENYSGEMGDVYDVTLHNSGMTFESLMSLLSDTNLNILIPLDARKGGMKIKFITTDNKYVQYRLLKNAWSNNTNDWYNENYDIFNSPLTVSGQNNMKDNVNIIDDYGNILATIDENGIKTKNYEPSIVQRRFFDNRQDDVNIIDDYGNILATIDENGIKTKYSIASKHYISEKQNDVNIIDDYGNILATIDENGIKTKNYNSSESINNKKITLSNSEIITVLGSSFGETEPFPTNKHWSGIISMFSDYRIQNLSLSGSNVVTNLYYIRSGYWKVQGKYVAITNNENISSLNVTNYIQGLDNLCSTLIGMGKVPIICSNYHKSQYFTLALRNYAESNNLMYWDCAEYSNSLVKGIYQGFDDGAHLRRRNAPLVAYAYLENMKKMSRPMSSIKIFRLRHSNFDGNIDNLVYSNNIERAKLFNELKISSTEGLDEYNNLIKQTPIEFTNYALFDCILPSVYDDIKSISLEINLTGNVEYFIKNSISTPYPNPTLSYAIRFSVEDEINVPMIGDVYSFDNTNYTVIDINIGENNYYCTIYCSPNTLPSSESGILVLVSQMSGSTGPSNIEFVLVERVSLNLTSYIESDNKGHWKSLGTFDQNGSTKIDIPQELLFGSIEIDKISILIKNNNNSTFTMKDVSINIVSNKEKEKKQDFSKEWEENNFINTTELIDESVFGSVGTNLTYWKGENNSTLTTVANYEQQVTGTPKYPSGAESEIVVTHEITMNTTISEVKLNKFGKMYLEICCRYFPEAPIPYTQVNDTEVNNNSYDFNTLFIQLSKNATGSDKQTIVLQEEIGLFWKIVRFPIIWYWELYYGGDVIIKDLNIKLYSNEKGIEICRTSLKYIN